MKCSQQVERRARAVEDCLKSFQKAGVFSAYGQSLSGLSQTSDEVGDAYEVVDEPEPSQERIWDKAYEKRRSDWHRKNQLVMEQDVLDLAEPSSSTANEVDNSTSDDF